MLILTRRLGESVRIGDEVSVTVLGVKGTQVRLGFAAPKELAVHREEVYERIHTARIAIEQASPGKFVAATLRPGVCGSGQATKERAALGHEAALVVSVEDQTRGM